jgi:hypothetical protein
MIHVILKNSPLLTLLCLLLLPLRVYPYDAVQSTERVNANLEKYNIDSEQLSVLYEKDAGEWQALPQTEKYLLVKGTIINLDINTASDAALLEQHTQASMKCLDSGSHGLKLTADEDIKLPLITCITRVYEKKQLN